MKHRSNQRKASKSHKSRGRKGRKGSRKSRGRKGARKSGRKFSVCRNYKKSKCATDDKCTWRKNTGCVVARGKSKRKLNKSFMNMINKGGFKLKHVMPKMKMD